MATKNPRATVKNRTHEGAPAAVINAEQQLRRSVLACLLWEDTFYEQGESIADRIHETALRVKPEKVAALAEEARKQFYLRHAPLWLVQTLVGRYPVKDVLPVVIQRPDELMETLAMYWRDGRKPIPAQVKKGLAKAFDNFDTYQLAKYRGENRQIKLRDVLAMVRPKPKDAERSKVYKAILEGTLKSKGTWERKLSDGTEKKTEEDKKERWIEMLDSGKMGGMALIRNLRNMEQAGVPTDKIKQAILLGKYNKVLPFRFLSAAKHAPRFEQELEHAMFLATGDMEKLKGKTVLCIDHSGSMEAQLSGKSELEYWEAAIGLGILLREIAEEVEILAFSNQAWVVPPRRGFALRDAFQNSGHWGGTNIWTAIEKAQNYKADRIIVITDEQSHQAIGGPGAAKGYFINVAAYQNGVGYGPWTHIDGWSEATVRYIQEVER